VLIDASDDLHALADRFLLDDLWGLADERSAAPLREVLRNFGPGSRRGRPKDCSDGRLDRWFSDPSAGFELTGIVNRLDRADMVPDTCGETRFIYRMTNAQGERLPVALAVVFLQPDDGAQCRTVAQQWMLAGNRVTVLADPGGPLDPAALPSRPARVELNAQSAEDAQGRTCNELRVFVHERDDRFTPTVREAAPGWPVYTASSRVSLARKLTQSPWVESVVQGTLTKRPPVSGKKGSSGSGWWFAPEPRASYSAPGRGMLHGEGSTADAAGEYSALMSADFFRGLDLPPELPTAEAFLERLDGMTCAGCHATGSVDGFHLSADPASPRSAHLEAQLPWREAYVAALAEGTTPNRRRPPHNPSAK
jgi:hypothetical protein